MHRLKHCLVHAVGLDGELEDGQDGFLAEPVRDLVAEALAKVVNWVVLQVVWALSLRGMRPVLFC